MISRLLQQSSVQLLSQQSTRLLTRLYGKDKPPPNYSLENLPKTGLRMPGSEDYKNPWEVFKYEFHSDPEDMIPRQTDTLIIGGGIMGWSVAYFLRNACNTTVTVVERDPSYTRAATVLSVGGIRQQFSQTENIQMSLFGAEFLRNIREHLSVLDGDPPDIQFSPQGYLLLASEKEVEQLEMNYKLQKELGAKVELLSKAKVKERWPWINVEDVELGCYGFENEGWFDPWLLLSAFRRKAVSLGVTFVYGDLVGFEHKDMVLPTMSGDKTERRKQLRTALVRSAGDGNTYPITFGNVVNAAGPWAGEVAKMAEIGTGGAGLIPLPVEPRRQYMYVVSPKTVESPQDVPGIDAPWLVDSAGLQLRREGLAGDSIVFVDPPPPLKHRTDSGDAAEEEPSTNDLDVDYEWFDEVVWPKLAHRVPSMEAIKVRSAWAGFYDYNYVDQNLIVGNHPYHRNMLFCNGSSGHGIQHAPAIGRALSELILFSHYRTIDLERFSFDRFLEDMPIYEKNIF